MLVRAVLFLLPVTAVQFLYAVPMNYLIKGKIEGLEEGRMVFLGDVNHQDGVLLSDTAYVVNGEFRFEGTVPYPQQASITYSNSAEWVDIWVDDAPVTVAAVQGSLRKASVTGSSIPGQIKEYESLMGTSDYGEKEQMDRSTAFIRLHPDYYFSTMVLWRIRESLEDKELQELMDLIDPRWQSAYGLTQLHLYMEERKMLVVGKPAPSISLLDANGDTVEFSDYTGEYIYVDFWASYCAPCIQQMPGLKALQDKYGSEGFRVISVSMDNSPGAWKMALDKHGIAFTNWIVMNDNRVQVSNLYHTRYIPAGVLINPHGIVLAINPEKSELQQRLKENFGY